MAGEDESKDLQDGEDSYYRRLVSEEGGFGVNNQQLTDTDEQPGYDDSSGFTGFGDDDAYSMVDDDDADKGDFDDEDYDNDAEDFDGEDDYDDYDDYDDDEDDEDNEEDEDGEGDDEDGEGGKKGKKDKDKKGKGKGDDLSQYTKVKKRKISPEERAAMKAKKDEIFAKMLGVKFIWHEGEEITLETLQQYWSVFAKHVESLKEQMKQADEFIKQQLQAMTCGPNLVLNSKAFLKVLGYKSSDSMVQHILNLISNPGVTLLYGVYSAVESVGSQQWLETGLIFGLKTAMKGVLKIGLVQSLLGKIFSMGMKKLKKKFNYKGIVVVPK